MYERVAPILNRLPRVDPHAARSLWGEFRRFAFKGNLMDLAVGIIIGGAFSKIVDALVHQVLMPLVSIAIPGDGSYAQWAFRLHGETIQYGMFLAQLVNFLILAAVLFLIVVKVLGRFARARVEDPPATKEQLLLTEIRDLLKAANTRPEG